MKRALMLALPGAICLSALAFEVANIREEIAEFGVVTRTRVTDGKTRFSFVADDNWISTADRGERRVSLQPSSPQATINIQVSTNAMPESPAKLKEALLARYKDAIVLDQYEAVCGSGAGVGVDLQHTIASTFVVRTRFNVFRGPEGTVEVTLAATPPEFASFQFGWIGFINSFRVESAPQTAPGSPKQP